MKKDNGSINADTNFHAAKRHTFKINKKSETPQLQNPKISNYSYCRYISNLGTGSL